MTLLIGVIMAILRCSFDTYQLGDMFLVLIDLDMPGMCSVTNDAGSVTEWLEATLPGGIGQRRVFYRDSDHRYDELVTADGRFIGFRACTPSQQSYFQRNISQAKLMS